MAIEARTIKSFTSNEQYKLWFLDGELKSCSCKDRQYRSRNTDCKHMSKYRIEQAEAARQPQRNSCILCGRDTRWTVCGRCLE